MTDEKKTKEKPKKARSDADRREFLSAASFTAMSAGLIGGYGAFALISGRYLYPARPNERGWQFVTEESRVAIGESLLYRTPRGERVNITRRESNGLASDFVALSSICPHLGCQVYWEHQNDRYFCPCHNGAFDADGIGVAGPPGEAGHKLPRYPLKLEKGLLFIEVGLDGLVDTRQRRRT